MNEVRRLRVKCEIEQLAHMRERIAKIRDDEERVIKGLAHMRERIAKIRDDEERVIKGLSPHGEGSIEAVNTLTEVGFALLAVIGKLDKVRTCKN